MHIITQELSTGTLSMSIDEGEWQFDELFTIAQRRNPKRAFLFVSKILGKHLPVSPALMRKSYQALANKMQFANTDGVLFLGMAETAIGLACGLYEEASKKLSNSLLLTTTRHSMNAKLIAEFKEDHSHATDHLVYLEQSIAFKINTLVLIDDESTTGKTFANLIESLFNNEAIETQYINEIILVTLTDWSRNRLEKINPTQIPIKSVSLMQGDWHWSAHSAMTSDVKSKSNRSSTVQATITSRQDWGRLGVSKFSNHDWLTRFSARTDESIWVLGTQEFLYPPFLVAEWLEKQGARVKFSSTTRSPIALGLCINSVLAFADNYGQGIENYCYNLEQEHFDRVTLCIETDERHLDEKLIENLKKISKKLEIFYYE